MRRYWIDEKYIDENQVILHEEDFHHICEVCRQNVGDRFEVLNQGKAYLVEITTISKKSAISKIISARIIQELHQPWIHLCISMSKFQTMDLIIEKAVELGVYEVHPFISDFSFVRQKNDPRLDSKMHRWQKIIKSATQQCGRGDLMKVDQIMELEPLLSKLNPTGKSLGLFLYEGDANLTLKDGLKDAIKQNPQEIWVFIGSEGGYSKEEVSAMSQRGLQPMTLGDHVLRVETVCLSVLSILRYEFNL
jgi:16S rRNA (uracil1498-N3)-methyltransferase